MNLHNPLFLLNEWRRRRRALVESAEFAHNADFGGMVRRRGRIGARYFRRDAGGQFDDVQFFSAGTLSRLLKEAGFTPLSPSFSGFVPPTALREGLSKIEYVAGRIPLIRLLGYFYVVSGVKAQDSRRYA
jgi:hypothetical protein